jgi:hypothetical protein
MPVRLRKTKLTRRASKIAGRKGEEEEEEERPSEPAIGG